MKAKDPVEYKHSWQWHIDQLASLALAANIPYAEFTACKHRLEQWLADAISIQQQKESDCE